MLNEERRETVSLSGGCLAGSGQNCSGRLTHQHTRFIPRHNMKKGIALKALALALSFGAFGSSDALAQGRGGMGGGMMSSIRIAIEAKDSLTLTADQVTKLEALDKELSATNQPLREKSQKVRDSVLAGRDMASLSREDRQPIMQATRPMMEEIMKNDAAAWTKAEAVLNDAQKAKAKLIIEERRNRGRRPPGGA
jgi:hypothetical protein